jgi:hypothetical protein
MSMSGDRCEDATKLLRLLSELEQQLLMADVRLSPSKVAALLAEDFVEFGRSGRIYDRDQTIAALAGEQPAAARRADDFRLSLLGEGVALLTYRSIRQSSSSSQEQHSLRSSVWTRHLGSWRMRFHQGTAIS